MESHGNNVRPVTVPEPPGKARRKACTASRTCSLPGDHPGLGMRGKTETALPTQATGKGRQKQWAAPMRPAFLRPGLVSPVREPQLGFHGCTSQGHILGSPEPIRRQTPGSSTISSASHARGSPLFSSGFSVLFFSVRY